MLYDEGGCSHSLDIATIASDAYGNKCRTLTAASTRSSKAAVIPSSATVSRWKFVRIFRTTLKLAASARLSPMAQWLLLAAFARPLPVADN